MNGVPSAVMLIAAALLVAPSAARRPAVPRRAFRVSRRVAALSASGPAIAAVVVLGPAVAIAAGLVAVTLFSRRLRRRRRRDSSSEGRALSTALEVLVGELRVGSHPVRGFAVAAAEAVGASASGHAVGTALGAVAARARLGADVAAGLRDSARRSSAPHYWSRVAVYWRLAAEHGLPMATLMATAYRDITERQRFADRVDAALSGARATAMVLAGLPILGVLLGELVGAQPVSFLLGEGGWALAAGSALLCAGVVWSDRIIDRVGS
ncbi:MAG TPA: type II secretion system F family protein [Mycobacterium sp.]|nr:MAG: hypothetical protein E6Q56_07595 [Mycobacterium sp.]HOB49791.1 type II secretion system F family protein [Mycobacterium sp.]HPZ94164.1 type II secretion system F family protein [Mycobacterium sp.]HQE16068.1 type II secretion system F family protein [Mycobacterium sp.]